MELEKLQELQKNIADSKEEKAKAQGAMEQIEKQWADDFDCKNEEEVKGKIETLDTQITDLTEKQDGYIKEIETAMEGI